MNHQAEMPMASRSSWVWVMLLSLALTLFAALTVTPQHTGDSADYARDIANATSPTAPLMLEPGHLVWRPLGILVRDAAGRPPSADPSSSGLAQLALTQVSLVSTFLAGAAIGWLVLAVFQSLSASLFAVGLCLMSASVLNFGQAGAPYIPALAALSLGLWLGIARGWYHPAISGVLVGLLLSIAVFLWLPFVLVIPAALLAVLLLAPGAPPVRRRRALIALLSCAVVGLGAYGYAALANDIHTAEGFAAWIHKASHGISRPGISRVVLGVPRSFIHMGVDGREVKRYLLGDALNPVSIGHLATLGLWPRMLLFYATFAALMWLASRKPLGRLALLLLLVAVVPVVAFAAAWSGGEEERYLPLYPFAIMVACAGITGVRRQHQRAVRIAVGSLALLWLSNLWWFNPWVTRARAAAIASRLGCVGPLLDERAVIILPEQSDPLVTYSRDAIAMPPRSVGTGVVFLLPPSALPGLPWDGILAATVARTAARGGRVWIPSYALDSVPPRTVGWVEGAQAEHWAQIRAAFAALNPVRTCAETGFLEVVAP